MPPTRPPRVQDVYPDARPYTRWWWFSGPVREADLRAQLQWAAANGFGGVEIAWVYPQPGAEPGPAFLSPEWSAAVAAAKGIAQDLGLGCDFTFGTLWPFGGSFVPASDASRTFHGPSRQRLGRSWEMPHAPPGRILNHLDRHALGRYGERVGAALAPALGGRPSALFCDSWEVETDGLWAEAMDRAFRERFGYDLGPYAEDLDAHPDVRYDYRSLLADTVLAEFYEPLTRLAHGLGAVSRVQAHGAPTDPIAAYAAADVPESEAVLFDPPFARIAASAAALAGRSVVSAEAFTCLYGWEPYPGPGPHQGAERVADLKLVADALLAGGVNFFVWHGMPQNAPGGTQRFYASVHVGEDAAFADRLPELNDWLARVSGALRRGRAVADLAVVLPLEDMWRRGALPPELRRPSAAHYWEMHTARWPAEALGRRPLWVSPRFLREARFAEGRLRCGETSFRALYVDAAWLEHETLRHLLRLGRVGLPICMARRPAPPGKSAAPGYGRDLDRLLSCPTVVGRVGELGLGPPFLAGADPPPTWCRDDGEQTTVFFAPPDVRGIRYPLRHGQGERDQTLAWRGTLHLGARELGLDLRFPPGQSLLCHVDRAGRIEWQDIRFAP